MNYRRVIMLTDIEILEEMSSGNIIIKPFNRDFLGPDSYDVTLFRKARLITHKEVLDITKHIPDSKIIKLPYVLSPGESIIVMTNEIIGCGPTISADIVGRSNNDTLPLQQADGHIDPGFVGPLRKRITNVGTFPIKLVPNYRFAQVKFYRTSKPCAVPYTKRRLSRNVNQSHDDIPNFKIDKEWL
jgi:deoxycytidine triphosphate deaminase